LVALILPVADLAAPFLLVADFAALFRLAGFAALLVPVATTSAYRCCAAWALVPIAAPMVAHESPP
jgi:hypothetical protein